MIGLVGSLFFSTLVGAGTGAPPERLAVSVEGSIGASLAGVAPDVGEALAAQVARLIRWQGDVVRDVHPGDRLEVVFERGAEPTLLALSYRGLRIDFEAFGFDGDDGVLRYYDRRGFLIEPGMRNAPVPSYAQITETVQHGHGKRRHRGLDLKASIGSPIRLPFAARINRVNWSRRANGLCVEVVYAEGPAKGLLARFLHLSAVDPAMVPGQRLRAGAHVGAVGSTGHSSAPHLHYEIIDAMGRPLDPLKLHGTEQRRVAGAAQPRFGEVVEGYLRLLGALPMTN